MLSEVLIGAYPRRYHTYMYFIANTDNLEVVLLLCVVCKVVC